MYEVHTAIPAGVISRAYARHPLEGAGFPAPRVTRQITSAVIEVAVAKLAPADAILAVPVLTASTALAAKTSMKLMEPSARMTVTVKFLICEIPKSESV